MVSFKKNVSLPCFLLASLSCGTAWGQTGADDGLHAVKSFVNGETDTPELCIEFDKALANARPSGAIKLEGVNGKPAPVAHIAAKASSLCLFPLDRNRPYRVTATGIRGANGEKQTEPYALSFSIPDRSSSLAFTARRDSFDAASKEQSLRGINVDSAKIEIYRITDFAAMLQAWQDRGQDALAPSESVYLAHSKGVQVWEGTEKLDAANDAVDRKIVPGDKIASLPAGLYLMVASAEAKSAGKGLSPLAARWFTKSDFTLRAWRDPDGIHVFADTPQGRKPNLRLLPAGKGAIPSAETRLNEQGEAVLPASAGITALAAQDDSGHVAFTDVADLPTLPLPSGMGSAHADLTAAAPGAAVGVTLALPALNGEKKTAAPGSLRLVRDNAPTLDMPTPPLSHDTARLSVTAPVSRGLWTMRWFAKDGALLAESPFSVTDNPEAPRFVLTAEDDGVSANGAAKLHIRSETSGGKPYGLAGGAVTVSWQRRDPAALGWAGYSFGTDAAPLSAPIRATDFLTDPAGETDLRVALPRPPQDPGLYQAVVSAETDPSLGIARATPAVLPLQTESPVIGIKPLTDAVPQNGTARFALIGIDAAGKPRDVAGLSYQVYEEGRHFSWFQDEGRWKYRREPQLRPLGGGAVTVKADGGGTLEWPVTSGNYRVEILDSTGKVLATTSFNAGGDILPDTSLPLPLLLPPQLHAGQPAEAHVTLPSAGMITVLIADGRLRKVIRDQRPAGDNVISFIPSEDWQSQISLTVEATMPLSTDGVSFGRATAKALVGSASGSETAASGRPGLLSLTPTEPDIPILHAGERAAVTLALENPGSSPVAARYVLSASPGLSLDNDKGDITLAPGERKGVTAYLSARTEGLKDLRFEASTGNVRLGKNWPVTVSASSGSVASGTVASVPSGQSLSGLFSGGQPAFVARRALSGLPELLTALADFSPYSTGELAAHAEALRLWKAALAQTGLLPEPLTDARRRESLARLLERQNADGGFGSLRGDESAMEATADALTALSSASATALLPAAEDARAHARAWLTQRLANTWYNDQERAPRAAAYAALATADALDAASLRYFSDVNATAPMPAVAEAQIAAAFKRMRDPNAAAFWIKKMLDEHGKDADAPLLSALASTDALSSDDVHNAMEKFADSFRQGENPAPIDAARILRALADDLAGDEAVRLTINDQKQTVATGSVLSAGDLAAPGLRNAIPENVILTSFHPSSRPGTRTSSVERHIYRLNGVDLSPPSKPVRNETYVIEIKGKAPDAAGKFVLQDSAGASLRPIGCPLSAQIGTPAFIPWVVTHELSATASCEVRPHELTVLPLPDETGAFHVVYFAHIDGDVPSTPPRLRLLE